MQELPFLHSAHRLMLIDICMKFREDSFRGFQVTERTRFVTDRRADRRTSGRPGKNNMSPNPSGGDIMGVGVLIELVILVVTPAVSIWFSSSMICTFYIPHFIRIVY